MKVFTVSEARRKLGTLLDLVEAEGEVRICRKDGQTFAIRALGVIGEGHSVLDLNPIRAGMAETPEDSDFTSIQERLRQFATARKTEDPAPADPATAQPVDLLPFIGGEHADAPKSIAFSLPDYLQLVDWTGRAVRDDKRSAIPAHIQPIFQRMGLNHEEWLEIVQNFGRRYRLAAGAVDRLQAFGQRLGRYWLQGVGTSRRLYGTSDAGPARVFSGFARA